MNSPGHALLSLVLAAVVVVATPPPVHPVFVVAVALAAGVGIDLDHFVIAVLVSGSTGPIRRVLARPWIVVLDQEAIFEADDLTHTQRLLSHALIGGVAVTALWTVSPYWTFVVGVTIYAHVVADLVADVREERRLDPPA